MNGFDPDKTSRRAEDDPSEAEEVVGNHVKAGDRDTERIQLVLHFRPKVKGDASSQAVRTTTIGILNLQSPGHEDGRADLDFAYSQFALVVVVLSLKRLFVCPHSNNHSSTFSTQDDNDDSDDYDDDDD